MDLKTCHIPAERAAALAEEYRAALLEDIVPWWEAHSPDRQFGGFFSCLERDGSVYAGDKYMWMIGRQTWMLSHLYNRCQARPEWRDLAADGAAFMLRRGFRANGKMHFRLTRQGEPLAGCLSLYTECFALIALAEMSKAAGEAAYWDRAVAMYDRVRPRLGRPDDTPMLGYPINTRFHLHAHDMMRITIAQVFNEISPEDRWTADIDESVESILGRHWKPDLGALLENVGPDGEPLLDLTEGRMFHPGHATESAWMLMETALGKGDEQLMQTAVDITLAALEHGWDEQYGGLRYLTNIDRTPTHELEADMKLWWPHGEALYATLLGWAATGRDDLRAWHGKVHDYTFNRFPDGECGEWWGYLNRDGSCAFTAKANGWKGFFHLPRILLRCVELLSGRSDDGVDSGNLDSLPGR